MIGVKHSILSLFAVITIYSIAVAGFKCPAHGVFRNVDDVNSFYSCINAGEAGDLIDCTEGRGFVKNGEITGCVPFDEWNCTEKNGDKAPDCSDLKNFELLHAHLNPNYYWACPEPQGKEAIKMKCGNGRGFIKSNDNYGCMPWSEWTCSDLNED